MVNRHVKAGRKGGLATKRSHSKAFYSRIGKKGGKKGGAARRRQLGHAGYVRLGRKGGRAAHRR